MKFITTSLMSVLLAACAPQSSSESSSGAAYPQTSPKEPMTDAPIPVPTSDSGEQSYFGTHLNLIKPHPQHFGWVSIQGKDAELLYQLMQVKETDSNVGSLKNDTVTKVKAGPDISCFRSFQTTAPEKVEFACNAYLVYAVGWAARLGQVSYSLESNGFELTELYQGDVLSIVPRADSIQFDGRITLRDKDAKALFESMVLVEATIQESTEGLTLLTKKGDNITCTIVQSTPQKYECSFQLRTLNGEAWQRGQ